MHSTSRAIRTVLSMVCLILWFVGGCATMTPEEQQINHMNQGRAYYESGDYASAQQEFTAALALDPGNAEAHYQLGVAYFRQGDHERARKEFTEVIALDENYAKSYYNLDVLYANEGPSQDVEKAAIAFKRYLALTPQAANRQQIEQWLAENDPEAREKTTSKPKPKPKPKAPEPRTYDEPDSATDFKEWLKQQSEDIN